jgi:hypothetical protein
VVVGWFKMGQSIAHTIRITPTHTTHTHTHTHARHTSYALGIGEDDVAPRIQLQHQVARRLPYPEREAHDAVRAQLCVCGEW